MEALLTLLFSLLAVCPCGIYSVAVPKTSPGNGNPNADDKITNTTLAWQWLDEYNTKAQEVYYHREIAAWNYESNLTTYNQHLSVEATLQKDEFKVEAARNASRFAWGNFTDTDLQRQFRKVSDVGTAALPDTDKLKELDELVTRMQSIYSKAEVCMTGGECMHLEPGVSKLIATNRSYSTLLSAWKSWREASGKKIRPLYEKFVNLSNEAINQTGYADTGEYWRSAYEDKDFKKELESLFKDVKPLYQQLHTYVRRKLKQKYGAENFPKSGHIPAHLLGNMWAQQWNNILDLLLPYPGAQSVDVTPEMKKQNYDATKMFKTAEKFFTSLGLLPMPEEFWNGSIIVRPKDGRQLTCHASAWDFYNTKDFRIKMCTEINMEDLITIHHEMGHIQYFLQYKDRPLVYRDGANPGFHEAIGDTMALSVGTPKHLHTIGLLKSTKQNPEDDLNHLMKVALEKIAFLPFGYLIDLYRWDVFSGAAQDNGLNQHWWDLRCEYQGLSPPTWRSEEDFDPGAKFHVPANVPYIRYFVSFIVQFQFHKALCDESGYKGDLHKCDIGNSKKAGDLLGKMLKMGSSKPWPDAMKVLTKQTKMDAAALKEYFKPLMGWLKQENQNDTIGWKTQCPDLSDEETAQRWLESQYELSAQTAANNDAEAEWNYNTNLTDYNKNLTVEQSLALTAFAKKSAAEAAKYKWKEFQDLDTKEQMRRVTDLGPGALNDTAKLKRLKEVTSEMEGLYSKAHVCVDKTRCLDLDPGLTRVMAKSRDYQELLVAWQGWRNATGRPMKSLYEEFVNLSNEAVQAGGYNDTGLEWRSAYSDDDSFKDELKSLFVTQLKPLYEQLHAYIRSKLRDRYGNDWFPTSGHIPAHLLGNMWAQQWNNIYDIVVPYIDQPEIDVTPELQKQNFTAMKMFKTAEEFYTSIGLLPMPPSFWKDSMITKPTDGRQVVCHPSAWDFSNRHDYRIKMCTDITMEHLVVIHHEMGHIQYYLQYKDLPFSFRTGANPGFHEAVGDTPALSVSTPEHLRKIGLLKATKTSHETTINYLLKIALEKIAFLPFGYLIDQWRWSVFSGETRPSDYNKKWWDLRCQYQGLSAPVNREDIDFDPGAKYHVASNTPYIRYFVSFVIQFQFHKALCDAAGHKGPLHQCDIYRSKHAGTLLSNMLKMGASKPWPDAMFRITGQRSMDAGPLLEYFKPLMDWLKEQNVNENIGWSENCPQVPEPKTTPTRKPCPAVTPKPTSAATIAFVTPICLIAMLLTWAATIM